jgi:MFS family permease
VPISPGIVRDKVAMVTAMTTLPWLVLGLPLGTVADRTHQIRMMIGADVLRAAALIVLVSLLLLRTLDFAGLLVAAFVLGVGKVMFDCASFAVLSSIVAESRLETANGRLFTTQTVSRDLCGHLLGGVLYQLGRAIPLIVDAVSFVVSAVLLSRLPARPTSKRDDRPCLGVDLLDGVRHILRDRLLVVLTVAGGIINAVHLGQVAILVLLVTDVLDLGPTGYSAVLAVGAVGGVAGGFAAERSVVRFGRRATLLGALGLIALAGLGAALATVVTVVVGYFALGLGDMVWNVVSVSMRQRFVPTALHGRTIGAYRLVAYGMMPVGAAAYGAMARAWGTTTPFGVGAVLILILGIGLAPVLRRDDRLAERTETTGTEMDG